MSELLQIAAAAKKAAYTMAGLSTSEKNESLLAMADGLVVEADDILAANNKDVAAAREARQSESLIDRLALTLSRIEAMADGIKQVANLADPVGETLEMIERPNGLRIQKVRVPLGVVGMIYEARPNVTADAAALAIKTGNAILLRGSKSALLSNVAIVNAMRRALEATAVPTAALQLLTDVTRETAREMMRLNRYIDVLIPRGSASLIRDVLENATVPVIETGVGNCHIFIDETADAAMVERIVLNAKTQRPSVCNAAEKLLVHKNWPNEYLGALLAALHEQGVALRCDEAVRRRFPPVAYLEPLPASEYETEYLDLILGVLQVEDLDAAIEHINQYGSHHTETILTQDDAYAERFLARVDAAAVGCNVSSRFTDGFEYGFGAEIGISTQKLHARGPMGLPALTSYKYIVRGNGQTRD